MLNIISKLTGAILIFIIMLMCMGPGNLTTKFMDMPSFYMVSGILIGTALMTYGFGPIGIALKTVFSEKKRLENQKLKLLINTLDYYSQVCFSAGVIGSLFGFVLMLYNMSDLSTLGPAMSIAMITVLYGVCWSELFFQPLKNALIRTHLDAHEEIKLDADFNKDRVRWNWLFLGAGIIIILFFVGLYVFLSQMIE